MESKSIEADEGSKVRVENGSREFRPEIQGLRAVAILLVVLYHAQVPGISGGYVGVDIFFVVSGFLITGLLAKEMRLTGRIDYMAFYARRARRLLPASALVVLVMLGTSFILYAPIQQKTVAKTALFVVTYCSNFRFAYLATDYLAADANANPLLHTWSLAVEEQFYFFWPLLIGLGLGGGRSRQYRERRLLFLVILTAAASFFGSVWLLRVSPSWAFFASPARAWEFAIGALAVHVNRDAKWQDHWSLAAGGFLTILATAVFYDVHTPFPGVAALVPCLGTTALLLFNPTGRPSPWTAVLRTPLSQLLGNWSYSWYLWHWPVLVLAATLPWRFHLGQRLCWAFLALALAGLTFHFVEQRVRFYPAFARRSGFTVSLAVCNTVACLGLVALAYASARHFGTLRSQLPFTRAKEELAKVYSDGCHASFASRENPPCIFGDPSSTTAMVLFGDSHIAQWFPAIDKVAQRRHWKLVSLTKSSCPAMEVALYGLTLRGRYTECDDWREKTIQRIIAIHPAVVVLSDSETYVRRKLVTQEQWLSGLRRIASRFSRAKVRTVFFSDSPFPGFDVPECLAQARWRNRPKSCNFSQNRGDVEQTVRLKRAALSDLRGVSYVDVSAAICATDECRSMVDGVVVYQDDNHLSAGYVATLVPTIEPRLLAEISGR